MLFRTPDLDARELEALANIAELRRGLKHYVAEPRRWPGLLRKHLFARAIQGSNSIEGYFVSESDAMAAVEGGEPLKADAESWAAVTGYRNAMTYILQLANDPQFTYSDQLLRSLHFMMIGHNLRKNPGQWRPGPIYVRDESTGDIVYEGPDAMGVSGMVRELIDQLNNEPPDHPIVRGGMAHLNLVMIHPFSDGNGRMGRALETLVLAREGVLAPQFSSIEEYLGRNTPAYYAVLGEVGQGSWHPENDARPWIRFIIRAHHQQTHTLVRRTKETQRLYGMLDDARERLGLPERTVIPMFDAALGYMVRRSTYMDAGEVSEWQASRDLRKLVEEGFLVPHGEKRGRFYVASDGLQAIRERSREPRTPAEDPFAA